MVDTGVILAAMNPKDPHHERCRRFLKTDPRPRLVTDFVVAEAARMIEDRLGPDAELTFLKAVMGGRLSIIHVEPDDLTRIAELIETYADLGLGSTDASIVAVAERLKIRRIATLDHRHFSVIRPAHCEAFELVP